VHSFDAPVAEMESETDSESPSKVTNLVASITEMNLTASRFQVSRIVDGVLSFYIAQVTSYIYRFHHQFHHHFIIHNYLIGWTNFIGTGNIIFTK
jgi:hypothetical protein